uniref:Uncharacterized protein n=1 Tax=Zea mays TaxID=4577 RepID=C4J3J0_MAIZE|nr:unknown [Zea mays]
MAGSTGTRCGAAACTPSCAGGRWACRGTPTAARTWTAPASSVPRRIPSSRSGEAPARAPAAPDPAQSCSRACRASRPPRTRRGRSWKRSARCERGPVSRAPAWPPESPR